MKQPTRRAALAALAATSAGLACRPSASLSEAPRSTAMTRQPALYLPHGGGPWPWMPSFAPAMASLRTWLEALPAQLPGPPTAVLCITAHWEERLPTVSTGPKPGMLYDYSGFPRHTYDLQWPAPGDPRLATRVRDLLAGAGIDSAEDSTRGFDHGTFVPLAVSWPDAAVPTVQLSLQRGLDPARHLAIGRALASLRDEGVLIVGSGMSYHNMRGFQMARAGMPGPGARDAALFDDWLTEATIGEQRNEALAHWTEAPSARASHPREEHLLPLMVVAGAGGADEGTLPYQGDVLGVRVSAVQYG